MNEIQRMQYLSALDVDSYMPRFILPNAAEAKLCQLPIATAASTAVNDAPAEVNHQSRSASFTPSNDAIKAAADVLASLGDAAKSTAKPSPKVAEKPAEQPDPTLTTTVESTDAIDAFSLSLHRIGTLLVIDTRHIEMPLPTDRLLANIALALGYKPQDQAVAEILNWPFSADNTAMDAESARIDLQAFLDGRLLNSNIDTLLLLGVSAAKYILPENSEYTANLYKKIDLSDFSVKALVAPSLNELLQNPALKESLWQVLRGSSVHSL